MALSGKKTEQGRLYFGEKTAAYLKKKSRQAVENYHNSPILYFGIDWDESKKNFYGEVLYKKFTSPQGVPIKGTYQINQNPDSISDGIPSTSLKLIVSIYIDQLKELNVNPNRGDYFFIGTKYYQIYSATTDDVGPGNLLMNRERMRKDYFCFEDTGESFKINHFKGEEDTRDNTNPNNDLL